jgi:hypothetical protein
VAVVAGEIGEELAGRVHPGPGAAQKLVIAGEALGDPQPLGEGAVSQVGREVPERRRAAAAHVPGVEQLVGAHADAGLELILVNEDVRTEAAHRAGEVLQAPGVAGLSESTNV